MGDDVSQDTSKKPSGYPLPLALILLAVAPIAYASASLALVAAMPIGNLTYRTFFGFGLGLVPLLLAFRASAALKRRGRGGWVRALVALSLVSAGFAAIIGGLYTWRGLRPPHLAGTADHLLRRYVSGESLPPLEVVEPKPPLRRVYNRPLPGLDKMERRLLARAEELPHGYSTIEIWDVEKGALRHRFTRQRAVTRSLRFVDDKRLLALRPAGRVMILDADAGEMVKELQVEPLASPAVMTSTDGRSLVLTGKLLDTPDRRAIHLFDLETLEEVASVKPERPVEAFGVSSDFLRLVTVERAKRGLVVVVRHLPTGALEATIPEAPLVAAARKRRRRGRRIEEIDHVVLLDGGNRALLLEGTTAHLWDVNARKAVPFGLRDTKLYTYGVAPGGRTYFHRRTDAADPLPTGLYRLPGGDRLMELETRGQPPRAFFTRDGKLAFVDKMVFSTFDGRPVGGTRPKAFTLHRGRWVISAPDSAVIAEPKDDDLIVVRSLPSRDVLAVLPRRGENARGALSSKGRLYAVRNTHPFQEDQALLERLSTWRPPKD